MMDGRVPGLLTHTQVTVPFTPACVQSWTHHFHLLAGPPALLFPWASQTRFLMDSPGWLVTSMSRGQVFCLY